MDEPTFWQMIADSKAAAGEDSHAQARLLAHSLSSLDVAEIVAFETLFNRVHRAAYRADLWGAAYLINGGCSDDGFDYFRAGLIALGRSAYENALANPDSLADVATDEIEYEEILYVASEAYKLKTGRDDFYDLVPKEPFTDLRGDLSSWSTDGDIDDAKAQLLYPRLYARAR